MTTFAIALEKSKARVAIDTMSNTGDSFTKIIPFPHIGAMTITSGKAAMQPRLAYQLLLNNHIDTFDDFLEQAEDTCFAAYYQTCEELRDLEGIDCHIFSYPEKTAYPPLNVEFITIGYSNAEEQMIISTTSISNWDVNQFNIKNPQVCGRAADAIDEFEGKLGRYLNSSREDLMACIGYQAIWAEKQGFTIGSIGGGEINIIDMDKDRHISMSVSGTIEDCINYAKGMLKPKVSVVKGKKPSKNALCPCGSGRKYKSCCGKVK
jgi:hypothetical protein